MCPQQPEYVGDRKHEVSDVLLIAFPALSLLRKSVTLS